MNLTSCTSDHSHPSSTYYTNVMFTENARNGLKTQEVPKIMIQTNVHWSHWSLLGPKISSINLTHMWSLPNIQGQPSNNKTISSRLQHSWTTTCWHSCRGTQQTSPTKPFRFLISNTRLWLSICNSKPHGEKTLLTLKPIWPIHSLPLLSPTVFLPLSHALYEDISQIPNHFQHYTSVTYYLPPPSVDQLLHFYIWHSFSNWDTR